MYVNAKEGIKRYCYIYRKTKKTDYKVLNNIYSTLVIFFQDNSNIKFNQKYLPMVF